MFAVATLLSLSFASTTSMALEPGSRAPTLEGRTLEGTPVAVRPGSGEVLLIDFWASWCPPCRKGLPWVAELQQRYAARGLRVVTVNVDAEVERAQQLLSETGVQLPVIYDPAGEIPRSYRLRAMPSTFLVDRTGEVVEVSSKFTPEAKAALERTIERVLNE